MAVISTGNHPKLLWPGLHAVVMASYNEYPPEYTQAFNVETSEKAYEEDVETMAFDLAQVKAEGSPVAYTTHSQGFTKRYTHIAYALAFAVTREEMDDNLYAEKAFNRGALLGRSFRITKEMVHWNIFNRAFNTSYTGGDGKALIVTDHPTWSGNMSNRLATDADFSEAALEDVLIMIRTAKNSKNQPIKLVPRKLIVHPNDRFNAQRILKSDKQSGTANNDLNAVQSMGILGAGWMDGTYLTDTDAWFVTTDAKNSLTSFTRTGYVFESDNDFSTKNALHSGYERYSCGWTEWRGVYGTQGA